MPLFVEHHDVRLNQADLDANGSGLWRVLGRDGLWGGVESLGAGRDGRAGAGRDGRAGAGRDERERDELESVGRDMQDSERFERAKRSERTSRAAVALLARAR